MFPPIYNMDRKNKTSGGFKYITMKEAFLHFLWRWRRFDSRALRTTDSQELEILHPGELNTHSGPDFFNARIRLSGTLWAGNVEMHLRASEWLAHGHETDRAYDNVVLHVVLDEDVPIVRLDGGRLPCLALRDRIPPRLLQSYFRLENEKHWIPCAPNFAQADGIVRLNWLDRLLVDRLEAKTAAVALQLESTGQHWEEAFYRQLAYGYGLKINTEPFAQLARLLPLNLVSRYRNRISQVEALVFGQAGFLETPFEEDYPNMLAQEYRFLQHKHQLQPMETQLWKFLRLRPAGFPTLRLAQFSSVLHHNELLWNAVLDARDMKEVTALLRHEPSDYWHSHYHFSKSGKEATHQPGNDFIRLLVINVLAPFVFHHGKIKNKPDLMDKALHWLESMPPEDNVVLRSWASLGCKAQNAAQGQALLQLKTHYCDAQRCLECAIGTALLK